MIRLALAALLLLASPAWAASPNPRGTLRIEAAVTEVRVVTVGSIESVLITDALGCVQLMVPTSLPVEGCEPYGAVVVSGANGIQRWFAFTRPLQESENDTVLVSAQDQDGNFTASHVFRCTYTNPKTTVCKP